MLTELIRSDAIVASAVLTDVSRTLRDTYATLASVAFGSMRERVARHLLNLGSNSPEGGPMTAIVTQQQLADALGTAREVVARNLRDLRAEGLIDTRPGKVVILDPPALAATLGRWRTAAMRR
jgi:CRP/FNR family cyclic AMP-dependent transcriptional regulator